MLTWLVALHAWSWRTFWARQGPGPGRPSSVSYVWATTTVYLSIRTEAVLLAATGESPTVALTANLRYIIYNIARQSGLKPPCKLYVYTTIRLEDARDCVKCVTSVHSRTRNQIRNRELSLSWMKPSCRSASYLFGSFSNSILVNCVSS